MQKGRRPSMSGAEKAAPTTEAPASMPDMSLAEEEPSAEAMSETPMLDAAGGDPDNADEESFDLDGLLSALESTDLDDNAAEEAIGEPEFEYEPRDTSQGKDSGPDEQTARNAAGQSTGREQSDGTTVHRDAAAAEAAAAVGAEAFAMDSDIYLGDNVQPGSLNEQEVLAHEREHTRQAAEGRLQGTQGVSQPSERAEAQARGEQTEQEPRVGRAGGKSSRIMRSPEDELTARKRRKPNRRGIITYIQKPKGTTKDKYLAKAGKYWKGRSDALVTGVSSLQEIMADLRTRNRHNSAAWGEVNVVCHGTPTHILLGAMKGTNAAGPTEIKAAKLAALPNTHIDRTTNLNIHGCAVGNNSAILAALSKLFGGSDKQRPAVYAPKMWQWYQEKPNGQVVERLCEMLQVRYPSGKPSKKAVLAALLKKYPNTANLRQRLKWGERVDAVDWKDLVVQVPRRSPPKGPTDTKGHERFFKKLCPAEAAKYQYDGFISMSKTVKNNEVTRTYNYRIKGANGGSGTCKGYDIHDAYDTEKDRAKLWKQQRPKFHAEWKWDKGTAGAMPSGKAGDMVQVPVTYRGTQTLVLVPYQHPGQKSRKNNNFYGSHSP